MRFLIPFLTLVGLLSTSLVWAAPPTAPGEVRIYAPKQDRIHLAWIDNADNEVAYYVDRWDEDEGDWLAVADLPPNSEVFRSPVIPSEGETVRYRVAPYADGEDIENLNWVEATLVRPVGSLDLLGDIPEGLSTKANAPFSHQIEVFGGSPEEYSLIDLPTSLQGLSLNPSTGLLTGTVSTPGVYRFYVGVTDDEGNTFTQVRFLRVLPAASTPEVATPGFKVSAQNAGTQRAVDISTLFRDPARPYGAIFETPLGYFTVALHHTATPKTVANFLGYVGRGDYNASILHRSVAGFVIQGGGYYLSSYANPGTNWKGLTLQPQVPNEPGISNTRGTIAMAKLGGNPDSATSQWFVSTGASNPANLDYQNGGFTAFGQVIGNQGMAVVDGLNLLRTRSYNLTISGQPTTFDGIPVLENIPPATPGPNSLVYIYSVKQVSPVVVQVLSNSNPSTVEAQVYGSNLYLTAKAKVGTANLTLQATNLDGNTTTFTLPVKVEDRVKPTIKLISVRAARPFGTLTIKGRATDKVNLRTWKYKVNNKKWRSGGKIAGKSATLKKKIRGFKRGRNVLRLQAFDASGNRSAVLKQGIILN